MPLKEKGSVPSEIGTAVWVKDKDGNDVFSHIDVKPVTEEEIEQWRRHTEEAIKAQYSEIPGTVSRARMRALYASQMIPLVEENLEKARLLNDVANIDGLEREHARLLRDTGQTRIASVLYPYNRSIQRALSALDKPHGVFCSCEVHTKTPKLARPFNGGTEKYEIKEVWYPELGGEVKLYRCTKCKCENVSTIKPQDI